MKRTVAVAAATVGIGLTLNHAIHPGHDLKTPQARDTEIARQYEEAHKRDLRNYELGAKTLASAGDDSAIARDVEKAATKDLLP
jgi:hypothetical protein